MDTQKQFEEYAKTLSVQQMKELRELFERVTLAVKINEDVQFKKECISSIIEKYPQLANIFENVQ